MKRKILYAVLGMVIIVLMGVYVWKSSIPVNRERQFSVSIEKGRGVSIKNTTTLTAE